MVQQLADATKQRRRRILLVEDDEDVSASLLDVLAEAGHAVTTAGTGTEALHALRLQPNFEMIVLDLGLPEMDGWEFRLTQKSDPTLAHIPVIAISADVTAKAQAVDADLFMRKPIRGDTLCSEINRILALADRQKLRSTQLAHTHRMASLGMLAAGVGHEINNPLAYVISNIDEALLELQKHRTAGTFVREIVDLLVDAKEGSERIKSVVQDLRTFTRVADQPLAAVDLPRTISSAVKIAWPQVHPRAALVKQFGDVPFAHGDADRLCQMFLNLIVNAAQAYDAGNEARNRIVISLFTSPDGCPVAVVQDNGRGISEADRPHIFEPFFTTRSQEGGSGLGLALAQETLQTCGGFVEVESEVGVGTSFRITLRPWRKEPAPRQDFSDEAAVGAPADRLNLLVVDDEPSLTRILARALGKDHDVCVANSAEDAQHTFTVGPRFDVVLCDLMMPGMTGLEFYRWVVNQDPSSANRFIFMTGVTPLSRQEDIAKVVPAPVLRKPFEMEALKELMRGRARP